MRDRLTDVLEKADLALGSSADVLGPELLDGLVASVQAVRTRIAYPDDVLVVALAGGTGSGKSSLLNAMTGRDIVDVGAVRPTTSEPAAAVPAHLGTAMDGYLDRLGVSARAAYDGPGPVLVDLPDTDSVEVEHRHRVDSILPLVDLVIWVADPEKYRDARLHKDYLRPMAASAAQLLFVLNQADRLGEANLTEVVADFARALGEDGISEPTVIAASVAPPAGPPMGLEDLRAELEVRMASRDALYDKLLADLSVAAAALVAAAGTPVDFDARAEEALGVAVHHLVGGDTGAASDTLTSLLDAVAGETAGLTGARLAGLAANVPRHVERVATEATPTRRRGWLGRRTPAGVDAERVRALLLEAVLRPARAVLARRAVAVASIAELAIEVEGMRSRSDR